MRWAQQQRIAFIGRFLADYGAINRRDLIAQFQISQQQAAHDLRAFRELHPDAMSYDTSAKRYVLLPKPTAGSKRIAAHIKLERLAVACVELVDAGGQQFPPKQRREFYRRLIKKLLDLSNRDSLDRGERGNHKR